MSMTVLVVLALAAQSQSVAIPQPAERVAIQAQAPIRDTAAQETSITLDQAASSLFRFARLPKQTAGPRPAAFEPAGSGAPPRQSSAAAWNPLVFGGLMANGGAGLLVGGGVRGTGIMGGERHGLQFDGLWSNANYCSACDSSVFDVDYSGTQLAFSGAYLFMFEPTSGGWQPHVGGGIVFMRWSISASTDVIFPIEVSTSGTTGGIQAQGGISKDRLSIEARVQSAAGGGAAALISYRFGGSR